MSDFEPSVFDTDLCPPEWVLSIYGDEELAPEARRPVESHLVGCRSCRERVMALREEAALLREVLHERAPREAPIAAGAPARGLALGLVPALALGLMVTAGAGWLVDNTLPRGVAWLNPFRLTGAIRMAFDTVFMLRDEAPALYQLAVSVASLGSVAFLTTVAFSALTRRFTAPGSLMLGLALCLLLAPAPARAVELWMDDDGPERREVAAGETLSDDLVVSAEQVEIAGILDGDLAAFAERVRITGEVRGDVLVFTRQIEISGRVDGSVIAFAERGELRGEITRNLYTASEEFHLEPEGRVGRDALHAAEGVTIEGEIGRDLMHFGEWLELGGRIGRDVESRSGRVRVDDGARIGGDLSWFHWKEDGEVDLDPGASIGGEVRSQRMERPEHDGVSRFATVRFYLLAALSLASSFLVGMVMFRFLPWLFDSSIESAGEFFRTLSLGFVGAIVTPIALVVLALTLVGLPIALMGLVFFAIAIYMASILVAALVGEALLGAPEPDDWAGFGLPLLLGLVIVTVLTHLPFVSFPLEVLAMLCGLGLAVQRCRERWFA